MPGAEKKKKGSSAIGLRNRRGEKKEKTECPKQKKETKKKRVPGCRSEGALAAHA